MNGWILLLIAATAGSALSLIGGLYLLFGKKGVKTLQLYSVPFAAGALLAAAFFDLLPETIESAAEPENAMVIVLIGFLLFFVLERSLSWFHHHHDDNESHQAGLGRRNVSLIIIGDTVHNFIDGLAIGAAFLVSPQLGLITTIAIAAHEVPQEIGNFGLLLAKGVKRKKVLIINAVIALATVIGAALVYGLGDSFDISKTWLLGITAGFFIYIAASDIIPTIHATASRRSANIQTLVLLGGVVGVALAIEIIKQFVS